MNRIFRITCCGLLILLAGCSSLQSFDSSWIKNILYTPTPVPTKVVTPTPHPAQTSEASPGQPDSTGAAPRILRVWLPLQFDPETNNAASALLKQRLNSFEVQHPGLEIDVRIKSEDGDANLLNSLAITSMAAPNALPDLIALPRPMLETAVQKKLVRSLDDFSTQLQNSNWYSYAQELAKINGTPYGLPFAGDALVIIYRPELVWIKTWDDILLSEGHLMFPGADLQAQVGLSLYMSAGGQLLDAQGHPAFDQEILTQVLEIFAKGRAATLFPDAVTNISTDSQVLQEYRARRANMAITHYSQYHPSQDGLVQPLMGLKQDHYAFSTGWVWALAGQSAENQQLSTQLITFLTADDFLAQWTKETSYLPTRRSTAEQGSDSPIPAIIEAAQPSPSTDTLSILGPAMEEAITRVLKGEQPDAVARSVIEKMK
jgi:ABC-type glycerol-3-phosphate transport system substrate-binding protein